MNPDHSQYFKFVIIKSPKKTLTEKLSESKDIITPTKTITPDNNEKSMDEKNHISEETKVSEVNIVDNSPNNVEEEVKKEQVEQKNEDSSVASHDVQDLSVELPSREVPSQPQVVTSPSEITGAGASELTDSPQNSNFFKKFGDMIKNSPNNGSPSNSTQEQGEVDNKDSEVQAQQKQQIADSDVVNEESTKLVDENQMKDDKKVTPETSTKKRMNSLVNMKLFITRTSSVLVEKLKENFDNLDKKIYPDIDPKWAEENAENEAKLSREINEREELLGSENASKGNDVTNSTSQKPQSTQNIMADVGVALNERKEKLDNIGEKAEKLNNSAANFAELAAQIRREQEQKSKSWKLW